MNVLRHHLWRQLLSLFVLRRRLALNYGYPKVGMPTKHSGNIGDLQSENRIKKGKIINRRRSMEITTIKDSKIEIAVVSSSEIIITDVQSALDFMVTVKYETGCNRMILYKAAICEEFFDLRTRLAGEILQKFINYHVKIAIVGDFSLYTSKSLKDFIYESNKGNDIFFLTNEKQAVEKLSIE